MDRPTIVVIDDDNAFLALMHDVFTGEGYTVFTAAVAGAAFGLIARARPEAVILDLRMETPDAGMTLLRAARADPITAQIPILVCSADARFLQMHETELDALGAATLAKPFDLNDLLSSVAALIHARRQSGAGSDQ